MQEALVRLAEIQITSVLLEGGAEAVALAERFLAETAELLRQGVDVQTADVARALHLLKSEPHVQLRDMFERMSGRQRSVGPMYLMFQMLAFMLWLCVNAVFSTLGGLLGAMIFKKDTPPGQSAPSM